MIPVIKESTLADVTLFPMMVVAMSFPALGVMETPCNTATAASASSGLHLVRPTYLGGGEGGRGGEERTEAQPQQLTVNTSSVNANRAMLSM